MSGVHRKGGVRIGSGSCLLPQSDSEWAALSPNRVDFNRDEFTRLLADKGYKVLWQKAIVCPNRLVRGGLTSRDHDVNCTVCDDANGLLYYDELETRMLITGMRVEQSYYAFGRWDGGTVSITALPECRLHHWDRIVLQNGVARFHELIRRQPGRLDDKTKYPALAVENLSWVNRSKQLVTFREGTHFETVDGTIRWSSAAGATRPDDGTYYSVAYTYRPRYIIQDLLHQHRESTMDGAHYEFPVQALGRLEFLVRDESSDAPEQVEGNPFPGEG